MLHSYMQVETNMMIKVSNPDLCFETHETPTKYPQSEDCDILHRDEDHRGGAAP